MGYVEDLLASNEHVVYETRKHWIAPLFATATGSFLTAGGLVALIGNIWLDGTVVDYVLMFGGLLALVIGLAMLAKAFVDWWSEEYLVTNHKVMKVSGILHKTAEGSALEKINDITISQSLLGRWLTYGTLRVLTAADESNLLYTQMREPLEFRKQILDQKQEFEAGDARAIADAVRRADPDAGDGPAGTTTTAARPPVGASAEQVTTTIGNLARLRDAGAITPEEYEAKKTELLGRL